MRMLKKPSLIIAGGVLVWIFAGLLESAAVAGAESPSHEKREGHAEEGSEKHDDRDEIIRLSAADIE